MDNTDDLLKRARQLEPQALARIHTHYYDAIYRMVLYRVKDVPLAEDITSEVFTRFLEALHNGKAPRSSLRGWLYKVANNIVNDHFRRVYNHEQVALSESLATDDPDQTNQVIKKLRTEKLHHALAMLPEAQSEVLTYRFGADMSIRDVAKLMGRSEGAIKMLQARAVATLSQIFEVSHD